VYIVEAEGVPVVTDGWIERSEKKCDFRVQSWQAERK
jgi:hypothetical protein